MSIPFDADWRRLCAASDTPAALGRWAAEEPTLAGQDLDELRCQARSHDRAVNDPVLAALLRLAATDRLARRAIVEALMGRLIPIAAGLARRNGDPFDDVLAELAGWAWELAATTSAERWSAHRASNLARLAKRRYLAGRTHHKEVPLGRLDPLATLDGFEEVAAAHAVRTLVSGAAAAGTITPAAAQVLLGVALSDATDRDLGHRIGRSAGATKKARLRAAAQLRNCASATKLRVA